MTVLWKEAAKITELIGVRHIMASQRLRRRKRRVVVQWMLPYMFGVRPKTWSTTSFLLTKTPNFRFVHSFNSWNKHTLCS